jgi:hypothetical protein
MSKPSDIQLSLALQKAKQMKEQGDDPDYIAKTLLNHHYRLGYLEEVLKAADRYMNHGMAEHERMGLLRSIEKAKHAELYTAGEEREDFGLE